MPIPEHIVERQAWRLANLPTSEYTPYCDIECQAIVSDESLKPVKHMHSPATKERLAHIKDVISDRRSQMRYARVTRADLDEKIKEMREKSGDLMSNNLATLDAIDKAEADMKAAKAKAALDAVRKHQYSKAGEKKAAEVSVRPDNVPTQFVNYKRPVASPKMEVQVPYTTEGGTVLPDLPKHECEFPSVIDTKAGKFSASHSNDKHDEVLVADNTIFKCICGKAWYVRVRNVPFHAADYKGQKTFKWYEIHWYNFARRMDLNKREAK